MLSAYFDETGLDQRATKITIAGFLGSNDSWKSVDDSLMKLCRDDLGIDFFHTTDIESGTNSASRLETWKREYALTEIDKIISYNNIIPFYSSIDINSWNEIRNDHDIKKKYRSPIYVCIEHCIMMIGRWSKSNENTNKIDLIFAYQTEFNSVVTDFFNEFRHSFIVDELNEPRFKLAKRSTAIQCADRLASQINKYWEADERKLFDHPAPPLIDLLRNKGLLQEGGMYGPGGLETAIKTFNQFGHIQPWGI